MKVLDKIAYTTSCVTALPFLEEVQKRRSGPDGLTIYLPTVGLIVGAILAFATWLLSAFAVNQTVEGALLAIAWLAVTGGIHLDGLMDTADGIFSHQNRERMLEIMKDSRVGNFGVMAGFVILILKVACLATIPVQMLPWTVLLVPVWSRWCEVYAIARFPYLRATGLGKIWHDTAKRQDVVFALFTPITITVLAALFGFNAWIKLVPVTIAAGLAAAYVLNKKLHGQTGDTYGAVVEISEAVGLLGLCLFAR